MTIRQRFRMLLVWAACVGLLLPASVLVADNAETDRPQVLDIRLDPDGGFSGRIVNSEGAQLEKTLVHLQRQGTTVCQQQTDTNGRFFMQPQQGGLYQLVADQRVAQVRCWVAQTAPPHAQNHVQLVQGRVERGQGCTETSCTTPGCGPSGGGGFAGFLMNPIVIGTAIAAAVAIPLAVNNDDDDAS